MDLGFLSDIDPGLLAGFEVVTLGIVVALFKWFRKMNNSDISKVEERFDKEISRLEKALDQSNQRLLECERVRESLLLKITDKFSV